MASILAPAVAPAPTTAQQRTSAQGGVFAQQIAAAYGVAHGLPSADVLTVEVDAAGTVWVGTRSGLARFTGGALGPRDVLERSAAGAGRAANDLFARVDLPVAGPVTALARDGDDLLVAAGATIWRLTGGGGVAERIVTLETGAPVLDLAVAVDGAPSAGASSAGASSVGAHSVGAPAAAARRILAATAGGLFSIGPQPSSVDDRSVRATAPRVELAVDARRVAAAPAGCPVAVAAREGLFLRGCAGGEAASEWSRLFPSDDRRSWAPVDVRAVAFAGDGTLWFASPQGLGRRDAGGSFSLWSVEDGLPSSEAISAAARAGGVWLGTRVGGIHLDARRHPSHGRDGVAREDGEGEPGERVVWEYRQGRRWLPHDDVRDVAVDRDGGVWLATAAGVGRIATAPLTLADKARLFEAEIDRYHRRTPQGYVDAVRLAAPGDRTRFEQRSSDNDGLWTGMYGAGECFAYAATRRPEAKARATAAFRALAFLSEVTQGGSHPAPPGFIARSILPTDGPDPNVGRPEEDRRRRREEDALWKLIAPRWPIDASGRWYWKTDASSDELDGHFFLYALYHDLVAETDRERAEVRAVVTRIVDHLLAHDLSLHDHDGQPTRWAVFGPDQLNHDRFWWGERGLNSLSILSYLRVAAHVSGDPRYAAAARALIEEHAYDANVMVPKIHGGPGTGNQSDDEMAFMSFWNLLRYERDPALRARWGYAFHRYWLMERPERNPLFAYLYAASVRGLAWSDAFDTVTLGLDADPDAWRDAVDTLERYPLDRVDWGLRNSHRGDVVLLPGSGDDDGRGARGLLRGGKVLPIDERHVDHWNHDPWRLDQGGEGLTLADPASFLLPYYLGLHEGFLGE